LTQNTKKKAPGSGTNISRGTTHLECIASTQLLNAENDLTY